MAEPITWAAVGMAAISNVATWLVIIKGKNGRQGKNGNPCNDHGTRLTTLEANEENRDKKIDLFIDHNDKAHEKIFERLGIIG